MTLCGLLILQISNLLVWPFPNLKLVVWVSILVSDLKKDNILKNSKALLVKLIE